MSQQEPRAIFIHMQHGTGEDWMSIGVVELEFRKHLAKRVLDHLMLLQGDTGGFAVKRLTHSLQTAPRAANGSRDDEYIVCVAAASKAHYFRALQAISPGGRFAQTVRPDFIPLIAFFG